MNKTIKSLSTLGFKTIKINRKGIKTQEIKEDLFQLKSHRKWVDKVNRIILLAGINRGW